MKSTRELLREHIEKTERILIALAMSEDNAIALLEECKRELGGGDFPSAEHPSDEHPSDEHAQLYRAAVYNALATISTVPLQSRPNKQLEQAVTEAKEELKAILEYIEED